MIRRRRTGWDRFGVYLSHRLAWPSYRHYWRVAGLVRQHELRCGYLRVFWMRFDKNYALRPGVHEEEAK